MKISSLQENLKQGLLAVSHIAGKNLNLPILSNVLIEAKENNIRLITTNLEMGVVCVIRGKVEKEGVFTVDSKIISDYISLLPGRKIVSIEKKDNESFLVVESDNYKTKILGQEAEEFPLIPQVEREKFYSVKTSVFKRALSQVVFAVSTNEMRVELSGVLFDFSSQGLVLAATDSYRLAEKVVEVKANFSSVENNKKIIVPARTIQELVRILSSNKEDVDGENEEVKFYVSENQVLFTVNGVELVSRLIEGQYPDYKQIIPANSRTKTVVSKNDFVRAVKASSLFSKTGINDINLDFPQGKGEIVITAASGQTGENTAKLNAKIEGEDNGIVVNYRYLLDGLNNIDSENVQIEIIDSNTPCILRAVDEKKEEGFLYIIMPIKQ